MRLCACWDVRVCYRVNSAECRWVGSMTMYAWWLPRSNARKACKDVTYWIREKWEDKGWCGELRRNNVLHEIYIWRSPRLHVWWLCKTICRSSTNVIISYSVIAILNTKYLHRSHRRYQCMHCGTSFFPYSHHNDETPAAFWRLNDRYSCCRIRWRVRT
jgi:hypothetical protein